jgi:trk system potassium uptake protein TrkH
VPLGQALREATFSVVSVITTTGFMSVDYNLWGSFALVAFFLLTFVGACTGSTGGGIKIFRFEILFLRVRGQARHLLTPHGVFALKYNGRAVPEEVPYAVSAFFYLYLGTWAAISLGLGLAGCDLITATTGAATALSNVGPGLGDIIGPAGNFSTLPNSAKVMLTVGMMLGRLEFFTVFVLLSRRFWRN